MNFLSETPEEATTWPSIPFCLALFGLRLCTSFKDMQTGWLAANQMLSNLMKGIWIKATEMLAEVDAVTGRWGMVSMLSHVHS